MPTIPEVRKQYDNVFAEYKKDPTAPKKIEEFRRKYSKLTEEELLKTFTI